MTIGELRGLIREVVEGVVSERGGVLDDTVSSARAGFDFLRRAANAFQGGGFEDVSGDVDDFVANLRRSPELRAVVGRIEEADGEDEAP